MNPPPGQNPRSAEPPDQNRRAPSRLFSRPIPLFGKLLLWQLLNLVVLAALFIALPGRHGVGWNVLLTEPVRERLLAIASDIATAVVDLPQQQQTRLLADYSAQFGVTFSLHSVDMHDRRPPNEGFAPHPEGALGGQLRPDEMRPDKPDDPFHMEPPPEAGLRRGPDSGLDAALGPMHGPPLSPRDGLAALIAIRHVRSGPGYLVRIPALSRRDGIAPQPRELHAQADGLGALLGFLGVGDWVLFGVLIMGVSALLWAPFIWGISRTIIRMTEATQRIAQGRFEARVGTRRRDELGQLAGSINHMAERLEHHVEGQKQFLIDVAHEVTSPLARIQIALGLLGPELEGFSARVFEDIEEDVQHMSGLLNELLLYSRADFSAQHANAERFELQGVVDEVIEREDPQRQVVLHVEPALVVVGRRALLARAIANLVRNALRHAAGASEPVELSAAREGAWVWVRVADRGPGVPADALARLGEPFFRPNASRSRETGGTGLGLAIVRRCAQACNGQVYFSNRGGGGFIAELRLEATVVS